MSGPGFLQDPLGGVGGMSVMNSSSAEQRKPSFSHMTRWSSSAAVSSRKQMRPDKWRGCHIVHLGFVYLCVFLL